MSLEETPRRKSLKSLQALIAALDATIFLATGMVGLLTITGILIALIFENPVVTAILVVALAIPAAAVGYGWYYVTRIYDPPKYEILDKEGTLRIERRQQHRRYHYTRHQRIRATRENVYLVEFVEHWTGRGTRGKELHMVSREHTISGAPARDENGRIRRFIQLGRPLGRGQQTDICVRETHEDDAEPQLPYFRQSVGRHRTRRLRVNVIFTLDYEPTDVRGGVWHTALTQRQSQVVRDLDVSRTVDPVERTVHYSVTVQKGRTHHSYGMYWTWPDWPVGDERESGQDGSENRSGS